MDSGDESSPWDSPLTSARDPVKKEKRNAKNAGLVSELHWDTKEEKLEQPRSPQENSDSTIKGNGSQIAIELPRNKPSPRSEEAVHQTTPKSPLRVTSEYKIPPFEDFKQALKMDSDEDHLEKPFPLPAKNMKGAVYKVKSPKNSSVEDLSLWSSNATGNVLQNPQLGKNDITQAIVKGKGQSLEHMPVHVQHKNRNIKGFYSEMPEGQTQMFSPSSIGSWGGGEGSSLQQTKTKSVLIKEEPELKSVGYSAPDHRKNPKELGHINNAINLGPVYTEPDAVFEKPAEVRILTDVVSYKDDRHMYQFDYGHKHYYQARMEVDEAYMIKLADSSEKLIRRCWREVFGLLGIFANLVTVFLIELITFLSKSIFQMLAVGMMTAIGDHIIKPFLVSLFNNILQPVLIFLMNILTSLRNLTYPFIDVLRGVSLQFAVVLQAFRLVEVNINPRHPYDLKV
ncbi:hypothetical protein NDU88_002980 [Pleurodeles waltl]|uniref:Uncharacterized protein n=1 Tax=Pleurodeles waltl TaxID=8319 RepID=A0AAV7SE68_PLEWA|nr:hypothetical protein NDU88_002980 [Pleurodeles waltl]